MAMAGAGKKVDMPSGAGVVAGHLVAAEGQRELAPAIDGRGMVHTTRQGPIKIGGLRDDLERCLTIGDGVAPGERQPIGLTLGDQAALQRFGGPGQHDARAHGVQAQHLHLVH